ncbi:hypothetical protein DBR47_07155 [Paucibacter sp. KBW04]|uniref:hypothetical protein n=1 Tax=Paucibacter sp. KBW04 TaxID=2153361 RepID=UPI000F5752B1|nr:hypothetical protein [Paucibacter sp. KBW04]RQO61890.1 hypothetical protein DBR47_07155 [Paucibacter sp. KBW04]
MALDVPGGRKNTAVNHSDYVVFEEMLSNAIDSYLIRRSRLATAPPFWMSVVVKISQADLFDSKFSVEISCTDNGAGFGDDEVKAFVTKDSTFKDLLQIPGIGKCKGAGRIQFFHHFERMLIDSVFERDEKIKRRQLQVDDSTRLVSEQSFVTTPADGSQITTTFTLKGRRQVALTPEQRADEASVPEIFSAKAIVDHLYTTFLQRFIILKKLIGDFKIEVESRHGNVFKTEFIDDKVLPEPVGEVARLPLVCAHSKELRTGPTLLITRYSFSQAIFPTFQHEVALCANSAVVQQITKRYLRNSIDRKRPTAGRFELLLVESDLFEEKVNQQRDGFNIPATCTESDTLKEEFSLEDVVSSLEDYVFQIITPPDFDKDGLVRSTEQRFGITRQMMEGTNIKIHYGDNEENIARRVLKKLQEEIVGDTSNLFTMKNELLKLDPRSADFRGKVSELAWKYTSSIKKMDMTNLSQLVVRRSAMIEVLGMAVDGLLNCQAPEPGKKNENERIIHNIFFPMGKDSIETAEHDIWLLNEEYQYFEYIASDKPLKSIKWTATESMFEPDIDESLEKLFAANNKNHDSKRPDIALFTKEGSAIIIEFKAPDVGLQEHIPDLAQYARLLAAKSNGRIRKFYGYLIGCTIDPNRMDTSYTQFADGRGFFKSDQLRDFATGRAYGEIYTEVLLYQHFIDRAEVRLRVYKDKLKVQLD